MKLAMLLPYSNRFSEAVDRVVQLEKAGLDLIYVPGHMPLMLYQQWVTLLRKLKQCR